MWYTFWNSLDMWWARHDYIICLIVGACFLFLIWLWGYTVGRNAKKWEKEYMLDLIHSKIHSDHIKDEILNTAQQAGYFNLRDGNE